MHFDSFVHDHLVIARLRQPEIASSLALAQLVEAHHERVGEALWFVVVIGTDCPMPSPDARRQLATDQARLHHYCAQTRMLILGRDLRQSLVRSLVTGFAMLPGRARPKLDGSLSELLAALETELGLDPSWLCARLIETGLLSPREASGPSENRQATADYAD